MNTLRTYPHLWLLALVALLLSLATATAHAAAAPTPAPVVYVNQRLNVIPNVGSVTPPQAGTVVFIYPLGPGSTTIPDVALAAWSPTGAAEFYDHVQPCSTHAAPCWVSPDGP